MRELIADVARTLELSPTRWVKGRLSGRRGPLYVELSSAGDTLVLSAGPLRPLPSGLEILEGPGAGVTLDDDELSAVLRVSATNPAAAIRLVRADAVRAPLLRAMEAAADLRLREAWLTAKVKVSDDEATRTACSAVVKLVVALANASRELSLKAEEERQAARAEPPPDIPARRFVWVPSDPGYDAELLETLEREARARMVWGATVDEVKVVLRERGASEELTERLVREALQHAGRNSDSEIRRALKTGILTAVIGSALLAYHPGWLPKHVAFPPFAVLGAGMIGYGLFHLALAAVKYGLERRRT